MLEQAQRALEHVEPSDIAVLARKKEGWKTAETALRRGAVEVFRLDELNRRSASGVRVGTFAKSKGLEFKVVVLADEGGE